jgi:flavin reductase (DIM6/NTAB) family NADH-FMN oxidoreductase RutF
MDNKAMHTLSYGLFVLTAKDGEKDNGCITNTAMQAASEPNTITFCINKANLTHDMVKATGKCTVSVISEEADFELFKRFGFQSGRDADKFDGFTAVERGGNGIYHVTEGVCAYFDLEVKSEVDLGSHTMFIAEPVDMQVISDAEPATYAYYHANIKPQPAAEPAEGGKTVWRCKICGYIYEGEDLPDDFICPICKHPASDFEKVVI